MSNITIKYGVYQVDRLNQEGSNDMVETYEEALSALAHEEGVESYITKHTFITDVKSDLYLSRYEVLEAGDE